MTSCELCGKKTEQLVKVKIDLTTMNVCKDCAKYGKSVTTRPSYQGGFHKRKTFTREEPEEFILKDYAKIVREARQKQGIKPEDFARQLNEKDSLLKKVESGHFKPSFKLAKKLERALKIKLIETRTSERQENNKANKEEGNEDEGGKPQALTFGDLLKKAMKK